MIVETPHRRDPFALRTLLVLIPLAALGSWVVDEVSIVRRRTEMREFLVANVGTVESATKLRKTNGEIYGPLAPGPPEPVFWRRWLGDEAVADVTLPYRTSQSKQDEIRSVFPEAHVHARLQAEYQSPGGNMF